MHIVFDTVHHQGIFAGNLLDFFTAQKEYIHCENPQGIYCEQGKQSK